MNIQLEILPQKLAVCKIPDIKELDLSGDILFFGKTDEELSLVCPEENLPSKTTHCDKGWKGMRITGVLDFSLIGIISKISAILAENNIGIFVVSTYNTDYILVKEHSLLEAKEALSKQGYVFI